jgi:hypothetical protein
MIIIDLATTSFDYINLLATPLMSFPHPQRQKQTWKIAKIDEELINLFGSKLEVEEALYYMVSCE